MSERLFFAFWPGEVQRRALTRILRELPAHRGREVHPRDIHLTLVFLGQCAIEQRSCAEHAAERVSGEPFELVLDRIGWFPRARALWCGADDFPAPLRNLASSLAGGLEECGFAPERRPYQPHVTLVRKAAARVAVSLEQPLRWPVDGFALAGSRGGPPPRYQILRRWPLRSS